MFYFSVSTDYLACNVWSEGTPLEIEELLCQGSMVIAQSPSAISGVYLSSYFGVQQAMYMESIGYAKWDADAFADPCGCPFQLSSCSNGFTLAYWIMVTSPHGNNKQHLRVGRLYLTISSDGRNLQMKLKNPTKTWYNVVSHTDLILKWHHVTFVWRSMEKLAISYFDGELFPHATMVHIDYAFGECNSGIQVGSSALTGKNRMGPILVFEEAKPPGFIRSLYEIT